MDFLIEYIHKMMSISTYWSIRRMVWFGSTVVTLLCLSFAWCSLESYLRDKEVSEHDVVNHNLISVSSCTPDHCDEILRDAAN